MTTGIARNGAVDLTYEVEGPQDGAPLLLIMGLGLQRLFWPDRFRSLLTDRGFRVATFDNRDVGQSTHLTGLGVPSPLVWLSRRPAYGLPDMAEDARAVLDELGWSNAHVAGISLGGMIAQLLTASHPQRVRTLTSLSSTPSPRVGRPHPWVLTTLLTGTARDRDRAAEHMVRIFRVIGSPGYPLEEDFIRDAAARSYDRAHDPDGVKRQITAIALAADRRPVLRRLRLPALVIHGDADPLVRLAGGRATARALLGSKLVVFPRMGHDLPSALQPAIADEIHTLAGEWSPVR
ncbi:alpha/beta fold hydrolase [Paractinoplanes hotanensis]|uniref:Alpha/beta fold hydrolase n=1 Tax=Paractinoplanes hotanensis TaxID=2906497 RepID=A0ABT0YFJ1_9ACTN|nr:alpha/beta fold hydrolase [Actinoplanes hotanensis]MCM4084831.1 alpha/beta fold hydrolase [Actinoplanes hotanensis]